MRKRKAKQFVAQINADQMQNKSPLSSSDNTSYSALVPSYTFNILIFPEYRNHFQCVDVQMFTLCMASRRLNINHTTLKKIIFRHPIREFRL